MRLQPAKLQRLPEPPTRATPGTRRGVPRYPGQWPGGGDWPKRLRLNLLFFRARNSDEISFHSPVGNQRSWRGPDILCLGVWMEYYGMKKFRLRNCHGFVKGSRPTALDGLEN